MLRSLTPSQQVQILFATLFGLLVLASVFLLTRQFRLPDEGDVSDLQWQAHHHAKRLLRSTWGMVTVFWISWVLGDATATVLFALVSFLILREFVTLAPTRRADHRSLVVAFFLVLPLQYLLVGLQQSVLFSVLIPVYVFIALPTLSALGNEPQRFLERNSNLQWGIMVCVYGMSHVPALLLLNYPGFEGRSAFLVFFLVAVVQTCMLVQHLAGFRLRSRPIAPDISRSFQWQSWMAGLAAGAITGGALSYFTPLNPARGLAMGLIASLAGTLGHFVMKAIKRDRGITSWGLGRMTVAGGSGLLDRVDALCFAAPVFFHALQWIYPVR